MCEIVRNDKREKMLKLTRSNGYYKETQPVAPFVWPTGTVNYHPISGHTGGVTERIPERLTEQVVSNRPPLHPKYKETTTDENEKPNVISRRIDIPKNTNNATNNVAPNVAQIPTQIATQGPYLQINYGRNYANGYDYNDYDYNGYNYGQTEGHIDERKEGEEEEEVDWMECVEECNDYFNPYTFWGLSWDNVAVEPVNVTKKEFDEEHRRVNHEKRMSDWEEIHCRCRACEDFGVKCCLFFPDHGKSREIHKNKMATVLCQISRVV